MATAREIQTAYRTIARAELSEAEASAIVATGITFAAYVVELSSEFALTTGAAIAVSQVVTGLVPSSERLDILTPEADRQLIWYRDRAVLNPSLGPFEALGRGYANEPDTGFAEKYGAHSTVDFINEVYVEVYGRLPSTGAMDNLKSQIAFFNELYTNEGLDNVALQAKGAVLGQIVGYAFFDPSAAATSRLDDAVATFFASLAGGDTSGYGGPLALLPPLAFTSARNANTKENVAASSVVYQAETNAAGAVKFSLTGVDSDAALFRIDADTGALRFRASPDFEAPADRDRDNTYLVDITATDARGNSSTRSVAIEVTDVASITRVSVASNGTQGNGASMLAAPSGDGRFVIFSSDSSTLVAGDTNSTRDVFVHDRESGTTNRVSVASSGTQANGASDQPIISSDGRFAVFTSAASNLVGGDTHGNNDVFIVELATGTVRRASVAGDGTENNADNGSPFVSGNGRYVTFVSDATNLGGGGDDNQPDVFMLDTQTNALSHIAPSPFFAHADNLIAYAATSDDGKYIAFDSYDASLHPSDTNGTFDVFVNNTVTGDTALISVALDGFSGDFESYFPSMSADGRYVFFGSTATNLVANDTNTKYDVFLRDTATSTTKRISESSAGTESNDHSWVPKISADGRYVVFGSDATNLVANDTNGKHDIFVYTIATGHISRVSLNDLGSQAIHDVYSPVISADGRFVTFYSEDPTLVPGDTNGVNDVFIVDGLEQGWWLA